MRGTRGFRRLSSISALLALPLPHAALAQATAAVDSADAPAEEIVVTAQKRAERVQDVPISIAAFSAEQLRQASVDDIADLPRLVPNFNVSRGQQTASIRLNVRGIGAAGSTAIEPSVATFLDGMYVPRPGAIFASFLDIEAVEVLRGPQGTLFGRNASVGAINLRSALPGDELGGSLTAELGTADRYKLEGALDIPVGEATAIRVAGLGEWFGGYWTNRFDGERFGQQDNHAGRVTIRSEFTERLSWTGRADYSKLTGDGVPMNDLLPESVTPAGLAIFQTRLGGQLPDLKPFDRVSNQFLEADLDDEQWGLSSALELELDSGFNVRLLNGYRDWRNRQLDSDVTFVPLPIFARDSAFDSESHSHELQLISPVDKLLDGRFDFVAGLYYFAEDFRIGEQLSLLPAFCPTIVGAAVPPLRPACQAGQQANATDLRFSQDIESIAGYGQATLGLTEAIDLILGARWTRDEKEGRFLQRVNNPAGVLLRAAEDVPLALEDDRFTWRASLNWRPAPDQMLFASYSTGFKSGGFNSGGGNAALGLKRIFGPEIVKNYEIGARTQWLDRSLLLNLTLFRMDLGGFQDRSVDGTSFIIRNAGNLRQQGLELDSALIPADNVRVNFALAYLDSEFTSFIGASALPGRPGSQDLTGSRVNFSPKFSGAVGAQVGGDFGNGMAWSARSDLSFVSDANIGGVSDNNPQTVEDGYTLLGGRFTLHGPDRRWSLSVFGENLGKTGYCAQRNYQVLDSLFGLRDGVAGRTAVRCLRGNPRTFGVAASVDF